MAYLKIHRGRMGKVRYRRERLLVGSGIVEVVCKKVIGQRFNASGMFWSEPWSRPPLYIRTALLCQNSFNDFWNARDAV